MNEALAQTDGLPCHAERSQPSGLPPSMKEICGRYDIADPVKASNMITTLMRLFETVLREHVCRLVVSDADVAGEPEQIKRFSRRDYAE